MREALEVLDILVLLPYIYLTYGSFVDLPETLQAAPFISVTASASPFPTSPASAGRARRWSAKCWETGQCTSGNWVAGRSGSNIMARPSFQKKTPNRGKACSLDLLGCSDCKYRQVEPKLRGSWHKAGYSQFSGLGWPMPLVAMHPPQPPAYVAPWLASCRVLKLPAPDSSHFVENECGLKRISERLRRRNLHKQLLIHVITMYVLPQCQQKTLCS